MRPREWVPVAVEAAVILGILAGRTGSPVQAERTFTQAMHINAPTANFSPEGRRRDATIAWFHSALLCETARHENARIVMEDGLSAAKKFAAFGMMDGPAILEAFETMLRDDQGP